MSKSIDQRVLAMEFDNKQFESNVKTSIDTLDKLNKSLDLSSSSKSLDNLSAASNSFSLDGIGTAVDHISEKFSAFGIFSVEILRRISNTAIDCGSKMVQALAIDPAKQGFQEYELKMGSVQTIMAGTGESLETVNKYLQELNEYSDKTIYSFSDMTNNIGKFTNAGVKLEDAVLSMEGICNAAALAGANSNEATRAMYNFSQALSAGYVKLIDWKSIENANMATVEFKNQLLETALAVGTVVKEGDMFRTTTTDAKGSVSELFDATKGFNDALSNQWMTTDVLVQTLGKYSDESTEIGKKAFAASTELKTFTMMMGSLKEAAQSGWAMSMEHIVGDFEEAKKLWTDIGNSLGKMIEDSANERNQLIAGWADGGGRQAIIDGFGTAWKTVMRIIKPLKKEFRDIFPKAEAEKLIAISNNIKTFTIELSKNRTLIGNVRNTFKGFFAILGIGKQFFTALINTIKPVFGVFDGLGEKIFEKTGSLGEWLVNLNQSLKETAFFESTFASIAAKITTVFSTIKSAITNTIGWVKSFGTSLKENIKIPGSNNVTAFCNTMSQQFEKVSFSMDDFKQLMDKIFSSFGNWIDSSGLSEKFGKMMDIMESAWNTTVEIGKKLKQAFKSVCQALSNAFTGLDIKDGFAIVNGGLFASILISINKFTKGLSEPFKSVKTITQGIKDVIGSAQKCFQELQSNLKSDTLLKIATAIAILAASLVVLSLIDQDKLTFSLLAISTLMYELMTSLSHFSTLASASKTGIAGLVGSMIGITAALLILSIALKSISDLDVEGAISGVIGLAGMTIVMIYAVQELNKYQGKLISGATGLIVFAVALRVLAGAVKDLGELDLATLGKGLLGVGVLMAELVLFIQAAKFGSIGITTAASIVILSYAIKELATSVAIFGEMDSAQLKQGMAAMGVLLGELALFIKLSSGSKGMITAAAGLLVMCASMKLFADSVGQLGSIPIDTLVIGLSSMAVILTTLTIALNLLPKNMMAIGVGLVAVSAALTIMADAINTMGGMTYDELKIGLIALSVGLIAIVAAANLMKSAISGAAALLVVAAAISVLTPPLVLLSKLSWTELGVGLAMLGGSLAILCVAGAVAGVIAPGLLALAGALALIGVGAAGIGVGLLAAGAGLTSLAAGFLALGTLGTAGANGVVTAISVIVLGIAELIPEVIAKIGEAILAFCDVIIKGAPTIGSAILVVLQSIINSVVTSIPMVLEGFAQLLVGILDVIVEYLPMLIEGGMQIILSILQGIAENIGPITEAAIDIVVQFLEAIATKLPDVIQAGFDLLISFLNGMTDGINENTDLLIEAFNGLILAIVDAGIKALEGSMDLFKEVGQKIMDSGLVQGIKDKIIKVKNTCKELVGEAIGAVKKKVEDFKEAGKEIISGFVKGIKEKFEDAISAGKELGEKILKSAKDILGIASPSKAFVEVGRWSVMGLAKGLGKFAPLAADSAKKVGQNALEAMSSTLSNISNAINGDFDTTPVIRPVLDLSNVESGMGRLNTLFNQQQVAYAAAGYNRMMTANQTPPSTAEMLKTMGSRYADAIVEAINVATVPVNVNVVLEGQAAGVFKLVRTENDKFIKSTGWNPLSKQKG